MDAISMSCGLFRQFKGFAVAAAAGLLCSQPFAQTGFFRCVNADGIVEFTDRPCKSEMAAEPLGDAADAERKNQNDVRLARDQALIRRYEAERRAQEEALRAAQTRQLQVAAGIAARLARERNTRNAATQSTLPAGSCELCKTPGNDTWPGYMR